MAGSPPGPSGARAAALLALAGIALGSSTPSSAQDNADCLECHGPDGLALDFDPRLEVRSGAFERSAHGALDCVACHLDLDGVEEWPHAGDLDPVDCTECHGPESPSIAAYSASVHGLLAAEGDPRAPGCSDCHGDHDIRPFHAADLALGFGRVNTLCARCHGDVVTAAAGEFHTDALVGRTCLACHDAHGPHAPEPAVADRMCLVCHGEDEGPDPPGAAAGSVHGAHGISCALCHADVAEAGELPHEDELAPVDCGTCHPAAQAAYRRGLHSGAAGNGHVAATCTDCHGAHAILGAEDPRSPVFPRNLPRTCEACHNPTPSPEHPAPAGAEVLLYEGSVHGKLLLEKGLVVSASCTSCHGSHEISSTADPEASTSRRHVPYTCGACHAGMLEGYLAGAHGADFLSGVSDVPVCTDCHLEHSIEDPALDTSSVSSSQVAATCARCHADDELAQSYDLQATVAASWGDSYHGISAALGGEGAANCASCHGFHDVLPSSDPRSRVHPDNLEETCGSCHPWTGAALARIPVHSVLDRETNPVAWGVRLAYAILLGAVIGAFVLFILIDLFGRMRLRLGWGPPETPHVDPTRWPDEDELVSPTESFRRMGYHARLQHGVLILSFTLLVLTGLPVFLHDLGWVRSIIDLEGGYRLRGQLHRVGALALIGLSAWHLGVLALVPAARRWFALMWIRPRDVTDFLREMMFDLGIADWLSRRKPFRAFFERHPRLAFRERPVVGRYGLVEKLEYGAVLWGNGVMIASGAILWRPDWFLGWMPVWTFDVCRVVHGFEATLAFLAIIIWHMYHVHLRPGVFPMSRTWLTGNISRKELRHHHPGEYLEILEKRRRAESPREKTESAEGKAEDR